LHGVGDAPIVPTTPFARTATRRRCYRYRHSPLPPRARESGHPVGAALARIFRKIGAAILGKIGVGPVRKRKGRNKMLFRTRIAMRTMRGKYGGKYRKTESENRDVLAMDAIFIERRKREETSASARTIGASIGVGEESQNPICLGEIRIGEIEENAISRSRFAPLRNLFHSVRNKTRLDAHWRSLAAEIIFAS